MTGALLLRIKSPTSCLRQLLTLHKAHIAGNVYEIVKEILKG